MHVRPSFFAFFKGLGAAALACALLLGPAPAPAAGPPDITIIRDTEIETILKDWAAPVIRAAGLDPGAVKFILVQDASVNAFVAGGQNIFIFTGLLDKSENPGEVVGVIAHELGHIRGGHLIGIRGAGQNASYESLLGAVLGIGAAVLTGEGGFGAAIAAGSQSAAMGRFMAFSRVQESSADQAALSYLSKAGYSPAGFLSFMQKMESDEFLPASQQTAWVRTHPLARDRVDAVRAAIGQSGGKGASFPPAWQEQHDRMKAKLKGFITPERVAWDYGGRDASMAADYARAVALYRQNKVDEALRAMDALLAREKDNPYFLELKGQMLTDFGRVEQALPPYRQAIAIMPQAALIRAAYANALIETSAGDRGRLDQAIEQLERALRDEPRSGRNYRLLATAWGRKGNEALAKLYLAEEALLERNWEYAKRQAEGAMAGLEKGSRGALRAQDILSFIEQNEKKD